MTDEDEADSVMKKTVNPGGSQNGSVRTGGREHVGRRKQKLKTETSDSDTEVESPKSSVRQSRRGRGRVKQDSGDEEESGTETETESDSPKRSRKRTRGRKYSKRRKASKRGKKPARKRQRTRAAADSESKSESGDSSDESETSSEGSETEDLDSDLGHHSPVTRLRATQGSQNSRGYDSESDYDKPSRLSHHENSSYASQRTFSGSRQGRRTRNQGKPTVKYTEDSGNTDSDDAAPTTVSMRGRVRRPTARVRAMWD